MAERKRCLAREQPARASWPSPPRTSPRCRCPPPGWAQNITEGALKLGVLKHDVSNSRRGRTRYRHQSGSDLPVADPGFVGRRGAMVLAFRGAAAADGRGAEINTAGATNQVYFGATWSWLLASDVLNPGDGFTFGIFFGPEFNDGTIRAAAPRAQGARQPCAVSRSPRIRLSHHAGIRDFAVLRSCPRMPISRATTRA